MDVAYLINSFGFPVAVAGYLIWQTEAKTTKLTKIIENNTRVLERVNNTMTKCHR